MKDWLFYPLMAAILGAMVLVALRAGGATEVIDPLKGYEISGTGLQTLTIAPGNTADLKGDNINPIKYAVMSSHLTPEEAPSAGIFVMLGEDYSKAYEGKTLDLKIRARAGQKNPSKKFKIGFFRQGKGNVGFKDFIPTPEFSDYGFQVELGPFNPDKPEIYFGIWPDPKGEQGTIEVEQYSLKIVE